MTLSIEKCDYQEISSTPIRGHGLPSGAEDYVPPGGGIPVSTSDPVITSDWAADPWAGQYAFFSVTSDGGWTPSADTYTYQWYVNGSPVGGATSNTWDSSIDYPSGLNLLDEVTCGVTGHNMDGDSSEATSNILDIGAPPTNTVLPVVSGSTTLSVTDGTWDATPSVSLYEYEWFRLKTLAADQVTTWTSFDNGFLAGETTFTTPGPGEVGLIVTPGNSSGEWVSDHVSVTGGAWIQITTEWWQNDYYHGDPVLICHQFNASNVDLGVLHYITLTPAEDTASTWIPQFDYSAVQLEPTTAYLVIHFQIAGGGGPGTREGRVRNLQIFDAEPYYPTPDPLPGETASTYDATGYGGWYFRAAVRANNVLGNGYQFADIYGPI